MTRVATAWLLLLVAAALEVVWAVALQRANGLTRPGWALTAVTVAALSLGALALALRDLPVGTAYAVWTGLGAAGVATVGMVFLGEHVTWARGTCLVLILAGAAGLHLLET
ncbi:DMT family transporter [Blastococcus xanthinilyticus]|uniref:Quaternary ammonium compound-resistance protein SugE n=1 Tax=Blastococcus xanthinilyticus TaxID=1564164 RepID=A0A5S5D131_9ACTN|nr:SMR family transporter [Blastococcus xanthinilyticus]TYP89054.1 quaternary ammonium compound-resistance protein SugE [Blastococcus xanthinilyticus]